MPPEAPPPPLRLIVDSDLLGANWTQLNRHSGAARAGAAVKANAYGLGAETVTRALAKVGCRDFFVAHSSEGAQLVSIVDAASISVLHGPQSAEDAAFMAAVGLRPVINSLRQASLWLDAGGGACDLMVDTGINRLGLAMGDLGDPLIGRLQVLTLMSHLACADEDSPMNEVQRLRWREACAIVPSRDQSLANSAGISLGPDYYGTLTRPGLSIYGGTPRNNPQDKSIWLYTPFRIEAALIQVREIAAGETVGYNATFTASRPTRIGVVSIGYADGYLRAWSGKGSMINPGRWYDPREQPLELPVLGRVSMDMTVVDLTHEPELHEGDWLQVLYSLPRAAGATGLSQYELLTTLGGRFVR